MHDKNMNFVNTAAVNQMIGVVTDSTQDNVKNNIMSKK